MRRRVEWSVAESLPALDEVLRLQGLPANAEPRGRIVALLEAALGGYLELAEPRAVVQEISREAFPEVYRGEGRNAPEAPLDRVFARADRLTLFAATVGGAVTARIRDLFARNEPALAAMLDSTASAATDRLAELLAARFAGAAGPATDFRTLPYSPGYCGWHVSGQRALFACLRPEEIGITLNASCLMDPLKSVSGVLVEGPADIHRFNPDYPFCGSCRDKPCRERIASLARS